MTRPNELTQTPPNDPPEQFYMGARTTETKGQGRARKTSYTNMDNANLWSQLSIFDTGSIAQARPLPNELTRTPSNDRNEATSESRTQMWTKPTSYHNLAFLIPARSSGRTLA